MARILITGSTTGLGLGAARELIDQGHEVVLHARNEQRLADVDIANKAVGVVIGDLSSAVETQQVASQANEIGSIDAVIHNAGIYAMNDRAATPEGHASTFAVNVLAPYMLTALIEGPQRLIYLSSGLHQSGSADLGDIDWTDRQWNGMQAYSDSKLLVTAMMFAIAERWPDKVLHAVDPGWVPTRMGGSGATDDLEQGHQTQAWLAVTDDSDALRPAGYWFHKKQCQPKAIATDKAFQDQLLDRLANLTGVTI